MSSMVQDVRYGVRVLARAPGLAAVVVLSLALGIGANTAVFSVLNAVLLKSLPVKDPGRLVEFNWAGEQPPSFSQTGYGFEDRSPSFSWPQFELFLEQRKAFSSVFAFVPLGVQKENVQVAIGGSASMADGQMVSGEYFSGLGVAAILGRVISDEDENPGAARVVVISYGYWQRRFAAERSALGEKITIANVPYTIVGVTPREFFGTIPGDAADLWVPFSAPPGPAPWGHNDQAATFFTDRTWIWLQIMGRLQPGVTLTQAQAAVDAVFKSDVTREFKSPVAPQAAPHMVLVTGGRGFEELREQYSPTLFVLMSIVGLLLLIACANVATLLLARATSRQREISVRLALGASRRRLIRQLLTESLLLAAVGAAAGVGLAYAGMDLLLALFTRHGEVNLTAQIDLRVLAFTAVVAFACGVVFGLAPALRATRVELAPALKATGAAAAAGTSGSRFRSGKGLVVAQLSLSLLLLGSAALFIRTLENLENQNFGFNQHRLLLFSIDPLDGGYTAARAVALYTELLHRIETLPGVEGATNSDYTMAGVSNNSYMDIEGVPRDVTRDKNVRWDGVGPHFASVMGMSLLLGRDIDERDLQSPVRVALVSESFAHDFFGSSSPIGRRVGGLTAAERVTEANHCQIIGVVRDAKYGGARTDQKRTAYVPYTQERDRIGDTSGPMHFDVRTAGDPLALVPAVRRVLHDLDPGLAMADVKSQTEEIDRQLTQEEMFARLATLFGVIGLVMACIGLHGTMSYLVTSRTSEIGIRLALGAEQRDVLWMTLREVVLLLAIGVCVGISLMVAAKQLMASLLYGVKAHDPVLLGIATLVLVAFTLAAGYIPARRAARVDPMVALRYE